MKIEFKEINQDNYLACVKLKVTEEQDEFIAPNWFSLIQAKYEEVERYPLGIYKENEMVGFVMYSYHPADDDYPKDSWWIERFMIGKDFQNKGYGKESMKQFIELFKGKYGDVELRLSAEAENEVAISMYQGLGFEKTGEFAAGEIVMIDSRVES